MFFSTGAGFSLFFVIKLFVMSFFCHGDLGLFKE